MDGDNNKRRGKKQSLEAWGGAEDMLINEQRRGGCRWSSGQRQNGGRSGRRGSTDHALRSDNAANQDGVVRGIDLSAASRLFGLWRLHVADWGGGRRAGVRDVDGGGSGGREAAALRGNRETLFLTLPTVNSLGEGRSHTSLNRLNGTGLFFPSFSEVALHV